jgi:hypothetical protein
VSTRAERASPKSAPRKRRVDSTRAHLKQASAHWVREISETTATGARQVADEGDFWFLTTVRCLNAGVKHTKSAIERFGFGVYETSRQLTPKWLKRKSQRDRIRIMLAREAKRSKVKLSGEQFEQFSDRIATLLDLVFNGSVGIDEVAFEQDDRYGALDPGPTDVPPDGG